MNEKKYRSAKMIPSVKARFVNRWIEFHEAFPKVTMQDWCTKQNLSYGTFSGWINDPRYNRNLRKKPDKKAESSESRDDSQLSFIDALDTPLPDETEAEKEALKIAKDVLQKHEEHREEKAPEIPPFEVKSEPDSEPEKVTFQGPYVSFTCADYRIEIAKVIPIQDVNRLLGFASSMMHRKATRAANEHAVI